jgi:hypothetical protein
VKRVFYILAALALLIAAGCTGETGPAGPQGPPGTGGGGPKKILIMGTETEANLKDMILIAYDLGIFPLGTTIGYFRITQTSPTLQEMMEYDAILCFTLGSISHARTIGDLLADYVDAGGGVVLGQGAFSEGTAGPIEGRIMTDGYSPLLPAAIANFLGNRKIDFFSMQFPLHPVFNGTDLLNLCYQSQSWLSQPNLAPWGNIIALDTSCANPPTTSWPGVAINDAENVIGVNIMPTWFSSYDLFPEMPQLIANCLMYVAR